jgi:oxygen-dependent protoporphyrinogen oxidase
MPKVVIVGAGISGLSVAFRLEQALPDAEVTVLEQQARPGGTVWTERRDGFQVEFGPNGFLDTKPSTLALCRDLGLANRLMAADETAARNRYLFLDGRLRLLPGSLKQFLTTDVLTLRGKLGMLAEPLRPRRRGGGEESVAAFVRRRAGREAANVFADALVTGIYAGDPSLLSVRAAFPRLTAFEQEYGSLVRGFDRSARVRRREAVARGERPRGPRLWSFPEGLRLLIEASAARLRRPPLLGVTVRRLLRRRGPGPGAWVVAGEGRDRWEADAVILTCPAYRQAAVLADLDGELAGQVGAIPYNRIAVVALGFRRDDVPLDLNGFGYIAPQRSRRDLLCVQWCSSIFPARAPAGWVLLRAMCGGWHRAEVAGWEDDRLLAAVRHELRLAMGVAAAPRFQTVIRWDRAIPQYHLGHLQRVEWVERRATLHPGLFLGGNAYHGVALNDCTEQSALIAARVRRYLAP